MQNHSLNPDPLIPPGLLSGIDHISFDTRAFNPPRNDIKRACRFFSLGELKSFEKEKGIDISHSNFFVFIKTDKGDYALKFYPKNAAQSIQTEYALNRFLIQQAFATPPMHANHKEQPFVPCHNRLAVCFSYIPGEPSWRHINNRDTIRQINTALLLLKKFLVAAQNQIPLPKQDNLAITIKSCLRTSRTLAPYPGQALISAAIKKAFQAYQDFPSLFPRQVIHNNASVTNFLVSKKDVYTLDLGHICEDYALTDLANFIVSCLFLSVPQKTIKTVIQDYFSRHRLTKTRVPALIALMKINLTKEYLKNIGREKNTDFSSCPQDIVSIYRPYLLKRIKSIQSFLRPGALDSLISRS